MYVAHTPKASTEDVVRIALALRSLGLEPSPHIVARRVESADGLRRALDRLVAHDIRQILLIAGDRAEPEGPIADTLRILGMASRGIAIPIHAWVAGPTSFTRLPQVCMQCTAA